MLKLNQESNAYPWITMGISTGLFGVISLITLLILSALNLASPIISILLLFLFPLTISLVLMDLVLLDGKHCVKMLMVSGLTSLIMGLTLSMSFPLLMILYTMGGNGLVMILSPVALFGLFLVPCLTFYEVLYGKKAYKPVFWSYVKASLPVTIVISLFVMGSSNLYWLGLFSGIGAGLGYSLGRKLQQDAIDAG